MDTGKTFSEPLFFFFFFLRRCLQFGPLLRMVGLVFGAVIAGRFSLQWALRDLFSWRSWFGAFTLIIHIGSCFQFGDGWYGRATLKVLGEGIGSGGRKNGGFRHWRNVIKGGKPAGADQNSKFYGKKPVPKSVRLMPTAKKSHPPARQLEIGFAIHPIFAHLQ